MSKIIVAMVQRSRKIHAKYIQCAIEISDNFFFLECHFWRPRGTVLFQHSAFRKATLEGGEGIFIADFFFLFGRFQVINEFLCDS